MSTKRTSTDSGVDNPTTTPGAGVELETTSSSASRTKKARKAANTRRLAAAEEELAVRQAYMRDLEDRPEEVTSTDLASNVSKGPPHALATPSRKSSPHDSATLDFASDTGFAHFGSDEDDEDDHGGSDGTRGNAEIASDMLEELRHAKRYGKLAEVVLQLTGGGGLGTTVAQVNTGSSINMSHGNSSNAFSNSERNP